MRNTSPLSLRKRALVLFAAVFSVPAAGWAAKPLPAYDADISQTSVSGISSGGYMAVQFHVAFSSIVQGAGVLAAGPYACAQRSTWTALHNCMQPDAANPPPNVATLIELTENAAHAGSIDATTRLHGDRVWLFSGTQDHTVAMPVVDALADYYRHFVGEANVVYQKAVKAGHAMITDSYGKACSYTGAPFIDNCRYDAAGALLAHIYGELKPRARSGVGTLIEFDQREFFNGDAYAHSMRDSGYAYIPKACASTSCRIHVALHGCKQNFDAIGSRFVRHAGYNAWAESNAIIVVYPQTISRYGWGFPLHAINFVLNPEACWDWWGYDTADYYTRNAPQMRAIKSMLDRLAAPRKP
jgi:poly(3-hydroxybutyrate) depolymerase